MVLRSAVCERDLFDRFPRMSDSVARNWQYGFVFRFTTDSITLYSDLQLTVSLCIQIYNWQYLFVFRFTTDSISLYSYLQLTVSLCIQIYNWQYLFVFRFTTDSISLYSDLQLTISNTAANATAVTTTTVITFLFTVAATFHRNSNTVQLTTQYMALLYINKIYFHMLATRCLVFCIIT